jgi:general secretion pathway protein E
MSVPAASATRARFDAPANASRKLDLEEILRALVQEKMLGESDALRAKQSYREHLSKGARVELHPLIFVADLKAPNPAAPEKPLTLESLTEWLSRKAGLPYLKIDPMKIDVAQVTQVIGHQYALRYRILPIHVTEDTVTFATAEPYLTNYLGDLKQILRKDIRRVVSSPVDVNRYLTEFYRVSRSVQKAVEAKMGGEKVSGILNFEQLLELGKSNVGAEDQHIVQVVDWLLQYAFEQRASDIHLEPRREMSNVRFRIDGIMQQVYQFPTPVMSAVVSRIKILGRMDVAEKRRPQDGRLKTRSPSGREVELRLSTMPTAFGEKCVMRIFDPDIVVKKFDQLGFTAREANVWQQMVERPNGIVLVTGPTGSGKTTTLYSTLKFLAAPEINVCTIEDPIEMVAAEFNQMQVQPAIDLSFANGIRTLLRQDPDIIMVGEIRDLETAEMAIQASLTGHLVLSTLHTNDSPSSITRLLDLGVPHYLIQGTLSGIMAQRLVRTLCPHCKTPHAVDEPKWTALTHPFTVEFPKQVMQPVGCLECRKTGYLGRTGIYEMALITPALRERIRGDFDQAGFTHAAINEGMRPLKLSAANHVARGYTTIEECLSVVPLVDL